MLITYQVPDWKVGQVSLLVKGYEPSHQGDYKSQVEIELDMLVAGKRPVLMVFQNSVDLPVAFQVDILKESIETDSDIQEQLTNMAVIVAMKMLGQLDLADLHYSENAP